ncbi:MAG: 2OG-Fe(II) oxygenase [Phycisphaerae bacterium]|nr:2OG-Fe(II) oxygenase [Phycisphaerae bacterium]MDW8262662.1 2OG-Fe(II) oxygenase [Phycisphaerales bacterium]
MIEIGDSLRPFDVPATTTERLRADDCVGSPLVLVFYLKSGHEQDIALLAGFRELHEAFLTEGIHLVGVGLEPVETQREFARQLALKFPLVSDDRLQLCVGLGVAEPTTQPDGSTALNLARTVVFYDASLRVVRLWRNAAGEGVAREVLEAARAWLNREPERDIIQHAPVLLIPNVLPPELCRRLIELWETHNEESGFMKQIDGKTVGVTDPTHKIRRDHYMSAGPDHDAVKHYLAQRVLPEIRKAFSFEVTRREDFRIACYDASRGGYFRAHRDNTTDGTAHRRFAMSLLLNDDYEGGYLRFPEFGRHRYRPPAGAACVFSCSLLHEATDVTAGRRFVLLSFFYGEAEARRREEYARRTGAAYRA